ncbi:hypothetical protein [Streptomyces sp. NPDC057428]|uniref:hypothetical protein n=1 Tax=Streptomyces sp. NPDC057428 TaxID=3346129 RepID=UPI0036C02315
MLRIIGRIAEVAEGQVGLVTEQQAAACKASPAVLHEFLEARVIETVVPGVVRLRGGTRPPFPPDGSRVLARYMDDVDREELPPRRYRPVTGQAAETRSIVT